MTSAILVLEYLILSIFIAPFSLKFAGMDRKGSAAAFFVGLVVYVSLGFYGFLVLLAFHFMGAAVTRTGYKEKAKKRVAQKKRSLDNVLANGLFPAVAAALSSTVSSQGILFFVAYVSTIAAAAADTVSSEIGQLSRTKPRLITTFEEVETGTNGGVSMLGTLSGLGAAILISLFAVFLNVKDVPFQSLFIPVTAAGFAGTTIDSFLGATLEQRGIMGNDMVNLISIGSGFAISIAIYSALT
jgi:uncharacterized protein (TIGR00297 family)